MHKSMNKNYKEMITLQNVKGVQTYFSIHPKMM